MPDEQPITARHVVRWFRFLGGVFVALSAGLLGLVVAGAAPHGNAMSPALALTEAGFYLGATGGAFALGCAWLSFAVARHPVRSVWAAPLLAAVLFALAWVRYAAFAWLTGMRGAIGGLLAAEVVLFVGLAVATGLRRTDAAMTPRRTFAGVMHDLGRVPVYVKVWLAPLAAAVAVGPIWFWQTHPGQTWLLAQVVNMLAVVLYSHVGLGRLLGLSHLVAWTPALAVTLAALRGGIPDGAYGLWLVVAAGLAGTSLLIDALDVVRWWRGDRALPPGSRWQPPRSSEQTPT